MSLKTIRWFLLLVVFSCVMAEENRSFDMFGKIKSSIQMAGKLLGLDQAKGVAELVSEAFGKTRIKHDNGKDNVFSGFWRVLGFDAKKISAIAVNAIIFVAQLISSSLSLRSPSQLTQARYSTGSPFDWMLNNSKVSNLLAYTTDQDLPDQIIEYVQERTADEETGCVQLLICKSSPFVWSMQKALKERGKEGVKGPKALFAYLPELSEVADYGDECEKKHPYCKFDIL